MEKKTLTWREVMPLAEKVIDSWAAFIDPKDTDATVLWARYIAELADLLPPIGMGWPEGEVPEDKKQALVALIHQHFKHAEIEDHELLPLAALLGVKIKK